MKIESYGFGKIIINGKIYNSDVIIYPDRVDDHWWRKEGHVLQIEDLKDIFGEKPQMLVIGTGFYGIMKVPPGTIDEISGRGIEVRIEKTNNSVTLFNELSVNKKVIAALHLTC